jgi:AAHS family 4-hydroxybenzoate transporter-like MFS transporter
LFTPAKPKINISKVINEAKISSFQIRVLLLCFSISLLDGFDTQSIAFVAPAISSSIGIDDASFGLIFSIGLLGSGLGALFFGLLGDKIGRKKPLLITVFLFSIMTLACTLAESAGTFMLFRFLAGIGLGGALPVIITLVSEYAPERTRSTFVVITILGFPAGAILGGLLAGDLINNFGWHSVFYIGGLLPLMLLILLHFALPESICFLPKMKNSSHKIASILNKIIPHGKFDETFDYFIPEKKRQGGNIKALFSDGLAPGTVSLGLTYFMSLLVTFFLVNWVPTLLTKSGLTLEDAAMGTVVLNFSGLIGSLFITRAIDFMKRPMLILGYCYLAGTLSIGSIGQIEMTYWPIMAGLFSAGFFTIGAQIAFLAVVSGYYPTTIRSTGVGAIQFAGRAGSLVGPIVGGALLSIGLSPSNLFTLGVAPTLVCAITLLIFARTSAQK